MPRHPCYNPRPTAARRLCAVGGAAHEKRMKRGFYTIMSAQFFSSLADNALLVGAIELLRTTHAPSLAGSGAVADVRAVLRAAGAAGRGVRRRRAQRARDVHLQRHQGGGLLADAVRRPPVDGLCRGGDGRRRLLAGEVRHPDRAAATVAAGQGQRLDRGADHRLGHSGRAVGRATGGRARGAVAAGLRLSVRRHRRRHAAGGRHRLDRGALRDCRGFQPVHPAHRFTAAAAERQCDRPDRRLQPMQRAPVGRQAGSDLAGHHHLVLGRVGQSAGDRVRMGSGRTGLQHDTGLIVGGRGGDRHRHWCGGRVVR